MHATAIGAGWQDDEHAAAGRTRKQGCISLLVPLTVTPPLVRDTSLTVACEALFGGCIGDTATREARSIDSDRFAERKSTKHPSSRDIYPV